MIVYHGSIRKFEQFNKDAVGQNSSNVIPAIGFWFTADPHSAIPFAQGTETVIDKSQTEFWEDGEPKIIQFERPVYGFIYKVYMDEPYLKVFESHTGDSYDLFMQERDKYCDYLGAKKNNLTWKDKAILLNEEEANAKFRKNLIKQSYEGFIIKNTEFYGRVIDLYCIFSEESLHIADVKPVEEFD
jgi:hypothetical protein